jgi:SAM-dependent methyltransferase
MSVKPLGCWGVFDSCRKRWRKPEPKIDPETAYETILQEAQNWAACDRSEFWGIFARTVVPISQLIEQAVEKLEPGVAVDLAAGNSSAAYYLLRRGWKVIAVDSSLTALDHLALTIGGNWIDEGKLEFSCQGIETYKFPKNVGLIYAQDAFPFCDPAEIRNIWNKAHAALAPGGRIVGTFFPRIFIEMFDQRERGAWFTGREIVQALLDERGYQTEICRDYYTCFLAKCPIRIEFMAKKQA